jgi:dGTP triphosphohydrolase
MSADQSEGFWSRLGWMLFEKLLLVAVAAGAVWYFQHKVEKFDKKIDQTRAVARVQTDILVDQRASLINTMTEYFLLIEDIALGGQADSQQSHRLRELRERVDQATFNMIAVDPTIEQNATDLLDSIRNVNDFLIQEKHLPDEVATQAVDVRGKYKNLLDYLSASTRAIAMREYEAIGD